VLTAPVVQVLMLLLSAAASLISGLVLFNLKTLKQSLAEQGQRITKIEDSQQVLQERKAGCQRHFVSAEQWIREESRTNAKLDKIADAVAELTGSVKIFEQMPMIVGKITREIVTQLNKSGD